LTCHDMSDVVAFADRDVCVHTNMKIDIKTESHLADETLIDFEHAWCGGGRAADQVDNVAARRGVHDLIKSRPQEPDAIGGDECAGEQGGPIIRALPRCAADQRNTDPHESGDRRERIRAMMPGVGLHRGALSAATEMNDASVPKFFHYDRSDEHDQCE